MQLDDIPLGGVFGRQVSILIRLRSRMQRENIKRLGVENLFQSSSG